MKEKLSFEELEKTIKKLERENLELKKGSGSLTPETGKTGTGNCGGKENEKIFQIIFDHSPLAIMYTDQNGIITTCNEKATKLFGARREKLIGFSYRSIVNERMREAISRALGGKKSSFEGEYLTVTGNF